MSAIQMILHRIKISYCPHSVFVIFLFYLKPGLDNILRVGEDPRDDPRHAAGGKNCSVTFTELPVHEWSNERRLTCLAAPLSTSSNTDQKSFYSQAYLSSTMSTNSGVQRNDN